MQTAFITTVQLQATIPHQQGISINPFRFLIFFFLTVCSSVTVSESCFHISNRIGPCSFCLYYLFCVHLLIQIISTDHLFSELSQTVVYSQSPRFLLPSVRLPYILIFPLLLLLPYILFFPLSQFPLFLPSLLLSLHLFSNLIL